MTRVLVVDDDSTITVLLQEFLEDEGYYVQVAPNGSVALDALPGNPPDIVLVDLRMPVMDGIGFVRACRQDPRWSGLRIVLLSAQSDATPVRDPFDAVVAKPFDLAELLRTVELVAN